MGMAMDEKRQRLPSETRRRELIDIAEKLCAERGVDSLKLREVARQAGISAPSIYNHFSSLDDLLAGVVDRHLATLAEAYEAVTDLAADEAMEKLSKMHVETFAAHPGAARLVLADFHTPNGIAALDKAERQIIRVNRLDRDLIRRGQKDGIFRQVNAHDVTIARIGMSLTLLSVRWFNTEDLSQDDLDRCASTVADFTLRMLRRDR